MHSACLCSSKKNALVRSRATCAPTEENNKVRATEKRNTANIGNQLSTHHQSNLSYRAPRRQCGGRSRSLPHCKYRRRSNCATNGQTSVNNGSHITKNTSRLSANRKERRQDAICTTIESALRLPEQCPNFLPKTTKGTRELWIPCEPI